MTEQHVLFVAILGPQTDWPHELQECAAVI